MELNRNVRMRFCHVNTTRKLLALLTNRVVKEQSLPLSCFGWEGWLFLSVDAITWE